MSVDQHGGPESHCMAGIAASFSQDFEGAAADTITLSIGTDVPGIEPFPANELPSELQPLVALQQRPLEFHS